MPLAIEKVLLSQDPFFDETQALIDPAAATVAAEHHEPDLVQRQFRERAAQRQNHRCAAMTSPHLGASGDHHAEPSDPRVVVNLMQTNLSKVPIVLLGKHTPDSIRT